MPDSFCRRERGPALVSPRMGKDEPQDSVFADLVAGGDCPQLPLEIMA